MAQIFKGRVYSSSPYPSVEVNYEYKRNGADMQYRFTGKVYLEQSSGWYYNNIQLNLYLNGSWIYGKDCKSSSKGWSFDFDSDWKTVSNKTSGTTSFYFTAKDTQNSSWCNYTSSTYSLTVAPAYTSITKFNVHKRDETSVTFEWSASDTCDSAWYSKDNGSNWSTLGSDNIVSGLSANTTYNFKLRVRRKDSQLTTDSGAVSQTTYDYPKPKSITDFIIGEGAMVDMYNPLHRYYYLELISNVDGRLIGYYEGTYASVVNGEFKQTDAIASQYASIPNQTSGTYYAKVTYGSSVKTLGDATYSIRGDEVPNFSNFTFRDTNTAVTNVIGTDQALVKGLSTLEVTISSANKMVAVKSANPKSYNLSIDNISKNVDYSNNNITVSMGVINSSGTKRINVRAYDTRNLSTLAYKDIPIWDYAKPVINIELSRLNNFETQTTLKVNGTYHRLYDGTKDLNSMTKVQYRYREVGGTWSNWTTLNTTITAGKFTCSDVILSLDNTKSFEFEIQAEDKLQSNTKTSTVGVGQAVFFISSNKKECYINGNQVLKSSDKPTIRSEIMKEVYEAIYPVGSIYTSTTNKNPRDLFGIGTWTRIHGRFLLGAGSVGENTSPWIGTIEAGSYDVPVKEYGGRVHHPHDFKIALPFDYGEVITDSLDSQSYGAYCYSTGKYGKKRVVNENPDNGVSVFVNSNHVQNGTMKNWGRISSSTGDTSSTWVLPPYYCVYMWERTA
jgi:hypothetical protein